MSVLEPVATARVSDGRMFVRMSIAKDSIVSPAQGPYVLLTKREARDLERDIRMALRDMAEARRL